MSGPAKRAKKTLLAAKRSFIRGKVSRRFAELRCQPWHMATAAGGSRQELRANCQRLSSPRPLSPTRYPKPTRTTGFHSGVRPAGKARPHFGYCVQVHGTPILCGFGTVRRIGQALALNFTAGGGGFMKRRSLLGGVVGGGGRI